MKLTSTTKSLGSAARGCWPRPADSCTSAELVSPRRTVVAFFSIVVVVAACMGVDSDCAEILFVLLFCPSLPMVLMVVVVVAVVAVIIS